MCFSTFYPLLNKVGGKYTNAHLPGSMQASGIVSGAQLKNRSRYLNQTFYTYKARNLDVSFDIKIIQFQ